MFDGDESSPSTRQPLTLWTHLQPALEHAIAAMEQRVAEEVRRTSGHWAAVASDSDETYSRSLIAAYQAEVKLLDDTRAAQLLAEIARLHEEQLGDIRAATRTILQALQRDPNASSVQRTTLRLLLDAGKHTILAQLVDDLASEIKNSPGRNDLLLDHALIAELRTKEEERAAQVYERVLTDDPSALEAAEGLLRLALRQRDWPRVARVVRSIASSSEDPQSRRLMLVAAALLDRERPAAERAEWLARAASLATDGPGVALPMAVGLFRAADDIDGAVRIQLEQTERRPEAAGQLHFQISFLVAQHEDREGEALRHAEAAVERDDNNLLFTSWLAELLERAGRWGELAKTLERKARLVSTREEAVETLIALSEVLSTHLGNQEHAIAALERALSVSPADLACLQTLGRLYAAAGRYADLAQMHLEEAKATEDVDRKAQALYRAAQTLALRLERHDEAVEQLEGALTLRPGFAPARQLLEDLYRKTERHAQLIELYQAQLACSDDEQLRVSLLERIASLADLQLRDDELAIDTYEALLELRPRHALALPALARLYQQQQRHNQLLSTLRALAMTTGDAAGRAALLVRMGLVLEDHLGQPEQALAHYREALDTSASPYVYEHLGRLLHRLERWSELVDLTEQQAEASVDPDERLALHFSVGRLQEQHLDNLEAAAAAYKRALQIDGAYWPAIRGIVRVAHHMPELRAAGLEGMLLPTTVSGSDRLSAQLRVALALAEQRPDAAKDLLRQVIDEHPESTIAHNLLLQMLAADKQYAEILKLADPHDAIAIALGGLEDPQLAFERSSELELGEDLATLRWRELLSAASDDSALARELLEQRIAAESDGDLSNTLKLRLAQLFEDEPQRAAGLCREVLEAQPTQRRALDLLERLARQSDDNELLAEALQHRERQATQPAERAMARVLRGHEHLAAGETELARQAWTEALDEDPSCRPAYEALKRLHRSDEDPDALRQVLERGLDAIKDPRQRAADLKLRAKLRQQGGDISEAVSDLDAVLELDPCQPEALAAVDQALRTTDHFSALAQRYERARSAATTPLRAAALSVKLATLCLRELEDPRRAAQLLAEAIDKDPDNVAALLLSAEVQARLDQPTEAVALLSRALLRSSSNEELVGAHLATAEVYRMLGVGDRALRSLRTVLKLEPKNRRALTLLAAICEASGNHADAEAYLARLSRLEDDPHTRGSVLGRLAGVLAKQHGNTDSRVLKTISDAIDLAPADADLLQQTTEVLRDNERFEQLASVITRALPELPEQRRLDFLLIGGEVLATELARPDQAKELLRAALKHDPEQQQAIELLVGLFEDGDLEDQEARGEAMQLHRKLLARNPLAHESIRQLAQLCERDERIDEAFCARSALVFAGKATEEERYFHKLRRRDLPTVPSDTLTSEQRDALLCPEDSHPIREVLKLIEGSISELVPADLSHYGISDLASGRAPDGHPAWEVARSCAELLGIEGYQIVEALGGAAEGATEPASTPTLVVPRDFSRYPMPQQRFLCGRMLARLATSSECADPQRPEPLSVRTLEMLLAALVRSEDPDFGSDLASPVILDDMTQRLQRLLAEDRDRLERARTAAREALTEKNRDDIGPWLARCDVGAHHAGLLCAGNLDALAALTERSGTPLGDALTAELVRFATSSQFSRLRQQVGLALRKSS
jgi:tetratricopeptide (TPR) repeat protein